MAYIDYKILGTLDVTPSEINDFTIDMLRNHFNRTPNLMRIDPFEEVPLCTRKFDLHHIIPGSDTEEKILEALHVVTISIIQLLKERNEKGEVILYYRYEMQNFNFQIVCLAFPVGGRNG